MFDARGNGDGKTVCTLTGDHQSCITDYTAIAALNGIVRRLTPLECERLQGYPDGWTDIGAWTDSKGKPHKESSDAARYMALGNSIALPPLPTTYLTTGRRSRGGHRWKGSRKTLKEPEYEEPAEVKLSCTEDKPPRLPKGYIFAEAKSAKYGYLYYKYVLKPPKKTRQKKKKE